MKRDIMGKRVIKLDEGLLRGIIRESIYEVMGNGSVDNVGKNVLPLSNEDIEGLAREISEYAQENCDGYDALSRRSGDGKLFHQFEYGHYEFDVDCYCFNEGGECISHGNYWNPPEYADNCYDFRLYNVTAYDMDTETEYVISKEDIEKLEKETESCLKWYA
jgi:hypothetical protein